MNIQTFTVGNFQIDTMQNLSGIVAFFHIAE